MIRKLKFASKMQLTDKSLVLHFRTLIALVSVVVVGAFTPAAQAQSGSRPIRNRPPRSQPLGDRPSDQLVESNDDIALAREKAKEAKLKFDTVKKLSRRGSASQKQLRDAELIKWLALLDLSNLVSPEKRPENSRLRGKLIVNYRNTELKVIKKLYERGSVSKLVFERAKTARDVAESRLEAVQSVSVAQRKINVINAASSKYKSAEKEHRLAAKLLQSGSISQAVMDRANSNFEAAKNELAEAKQSLGARAIQVQQQ